MIYLKTIFLLLSLGFTVSVSAQSTFGVHAGLTVTTFNSSDKSIDDGGNLASFNFGIPIILRARKSAGIQTGFDLVNRGASSEGAFLVISDRKKNRQTFSYLEIPVLLRLGNVGEKASFHFLVGPSLNFGLSGKSIVRGNLNVIEFQDQDIKRFELGGRIGAQLGFPLSEGRLTFEGLFRAGLTKLNDDDSDLRVTSIGYDLRLGYLIPLSE